MKRNRVILSVVVAVLFVGLIVFMAVLKESGPRPQQPKPLGWVEAGESDGVVIFKSETFPVSYCLVRNGRGVLIDCPADLPTPTVPIDFVLLTHHHRDSVDGVGPLLAAGVPVRANRKSPSG